MYLHFFFTPTGFTPGLFIWILSMGSAGSMATPVTDRHFHGYFWSLLCLPEGCAETIALLTVPFSSFSLIYHS